MFNGYGKNPELRRIVLLFLTVLLNQVVPDKLDNIQEQSRQLIQLIVDDLNRKHEQAKNITEAQKLIIDDGDGYHPPELHEVILLFTTVLGDQVAADVFGNIQEQRTQLTYLIADDLNRKHEQEDYLRESDGNRYHPELPEIVILFLTVMMDKVAPDMFGNIQEQKKQLRQIILDDHNMKQGQANHLREAEELTSDHPELREIVLLFLTVLMDQIAPKVFGNIQEHKRQLRQLIVDDLNRKQQQTNHFRESQELISDNTKRADTASRLRTLDTDTGVDIESRLHAPDTVTAVDIASRLYAPDTVTAVDIASRLHAPDTVTAVDIASRLHAPDTVTAVDIASRLHAPDTDTAVDIASRSHAPDTVTAVDIASRLHAPDTVTAVDIASRLHAPDTDTYVDIASRLNAPDTDTDVIETERQCAGNADTKTKNKSICRRVRGFFRKLFGCTSRSPTVD